MAQLNPIWVDLVKKVIRVSVVSPWGKEVTNKAWPRQKFAAFLVPQALSLVAFEACASAYHWVRFAKEAGHAARILSALFVAPYRQWDKTDRGDALVVAGAAVWPHFKAT